MKIKATAEVRKLLVDLDAAFQTFHNQTGSLAARGEDALDDHMAVEVGAERELQKHLILGLAYRINKASRGES
jgi:hypothetical protein